MKSSSTINQNHITHQNEGFKVPLPVGKTTNGFTVDQKPLNPSLKERLEQLKCFEKIEEFEGK